jgi:hypothetical protein
MKWAGVSHHGLLTNVGRVEKYAAAWAWEWEREPIPARSDVAGRDDDIHHVL